MAVKGVDVEQIQRSVLLGLIVAVSTKTGRGRWWVRIDAVSECGRFVRVSGNVGFGPPRWVEVANVTGRTARAVATLEAWREARRADLQSRLSVDEERSCRDVRRRIRIEGL